MRAIFLIFATGIEFIFVNSLGIPGLAYHNACLKEHVDASRFRCPTNLAEDKLATFADPENPCATYFFQCEPNVKAVCKSCPYLGGDSFLYFHPNLDSIIPTGFCDWRGEVPSCVETANACDKFSVDASRFNCPTNLQEDEVATFADPHRPCAPYFFQCEPNLEAVCKSCPYLGNDHFLYFHPNATSHIPTGRCDYQFNVPKCTTARSTVSPIVPASSSLMEAAGMSNLEKGLEKYDVVSATTFPCKNVNTSSFHCPAVANAPNQNYADPLHPCSPYYFQCSSQVPVCQNCPRNGADYLYYNAPKNYCDFKYNVVDCKGVTTVIPSTPKATTTSTDQSSSVPSSIETASSLAPSQPGCALPNPPCHYGGPNNMALIGSASSWKLANDFWRQVVNINSDEACQQWCCGSIDCITSIYVPQTSECYVTSVTKIIEKNCHVSTQSTLRCYPTCAAYQKQAYCTQDHTTTFDTVDTKFLCSANVTSRCT